MATDQSIASDASSRQRTKADKKFIRDTAGSQSLERGLRLLRAFHIGTVELTNAELAARTNLPRPTVSRLTRSLVDEGFLRYSVENRAYRLAPVVLTLAASYDASNAEVALASPVMERLALSAKVNVNLATADQLELVYLACFRYADDQQSKLRKVRSGTRVSMEQSATGRAYLHGLEPEPQAALLEKLAARNGHEWPALYAEIIAAGEAIDQHGFCASIWSFAGFQGVATPLVGPSGTPYSLNVSFQFISDEDSRLRIKRYGPMLVELAREILDVWNTNLSGPDK